MGAIQNAYNILVRKPEGKKPLGRPSHRWEDNIKLDLRKMRGRVWNEFIWFRIWVSGRPL
jgi:hypothetical protein